MKTIREWLSELPEPYKGQALANMDPLEAEKEREDITSALDLAFVWAKSPEGWGYWHAYYTELMHKPTPPTNALSALRAIAVKKEIPIEEISAVRPVNDKGEWEYQLINSGEHFFINLSNDKQ